MAAKNKGLGKGLDALFGEAAVTSTAKEQPESKKNASKKSSQKKNEGSGDNGIFYIDINDIKPNVNQPRKTFDEDKLNELADSLKTHGLIQPVVLRKISKGYEIVAGERRWRAARIAGLREIPCIVRELSDEENMLLAIIENMQREDLNPVEEAEGLKSMIDTYGLTQEEVSKSVGKSRPYIANSIRLLKLPEEILKFVSEGSISAGHGRVLAGLDSREMQLKLARSVKEKGMSVRQLERLAKEGKAPAKKYSETRKTADVLKLEDELKELYGSRVVLNIKNGRGNIEINFQNSEDLERLLELLKSVKP